MLAGALTDDARRLGDLAAVEAQRRSHQFLGCEHFLLALIVHEAGPASRILLDHGVTLKSASQAVQRCHAQSIAVPPPAHDGLKVTTRATTVLALAVVEAERLGEPMAGSAHILLALLTEGESVATAVLTTLGVDLMDLIREVLIALAVPAEARERYLAERAAATRGRSP